MLTRRITNVNTRGVIAEILLVVIVWIMLNVSGIMGFFYSTVASTFLMVIVSIRRGWVRSLIRISAKNLLLGFASAVILYILYYLLWLTVRGSYLFERNVVGVYNAVAGTGMMPVDILLLAFPISTGFEVFYRGYLQGILAYRVRGLYAIALPALLDAALHLVTGNPFFVMATLLSDVWWGATMLLTGSLFASIVSHAVWDIFIFVVFPLL